MFYRLDITARLQRRIVEIASTAIPLIGKSQDETDLVGLAHLREEMIQAVGEYARHVRSLDADDTMPQARIDTLLLSADKLNTAYDAFRKRWVYRSAADHWHEYRLSAAVLMKQIRGLVQPSESDAAPENGSVNPFTINRGQNG